MKMKRILSFLLITVMLILNQPYASATIQTPKLQIVNQPQAQYKSGDTISFTVSSPNYSGKVEYRVMLYNGTTKKTSELWNTPSTGYYYKNWQPSGNYNFTIHWPVSQMEPGAYSLTVLVRRVGSTAKYESHVDTRTVWIKGDSGETNNEAVNIDKKFIGDGTEKRVDFINVEAKVNYGDRTSRTYLFTRYFMAENRSDTTPISTYLIELAKNKTLTHIYADNKDYVMFSGWQRKYDIDIDTMTMQGLFKNEEPHTFEGFVYELFYDKKQNKYYLANEQHVELKATINQKVDNPNGDMPKYVILPVQIVDLK
jgi:hypothetical protein